MEAAVDSLWQVAALRTSAMRRSPAQAPRVTPQPGQSGKFSSVPWSARSLRSICAWVVGQRCAGSERCRCPVLRSTRTVRCGCPARATRCGAGQLEGNVHHRLRHCHACRQAQADAPRWRRAKSGGWHGSAQRNGRRPRRRATKPRAARPAAMSVKLPCSGTALICIRFSV